MPKAHTYNMVFTFEWSWERRGLRSGVWIQAGERDFFVFKTVQTSLGATQPPVQWARDSFARVNRLVCEVIHSLPPSAEVKKHWSYTSAPPISLHRAWWDNGTFCTFSFTLWTDVLAFFGRGDVFIVQGKPYLLVSRSYRHTRDSSPVITLLSTFPSARSVQIWTFIWWSCFGVCGCHLHAYISHDQIFENILRIAFLFTFSIPIIKRW